MAATRSQVAEFEVMSFMFFRSRQKQKCQSRKMLAISGTCFRAKANVFVLLQCTFRQARQSAAENG